MKPVATTPATIHLAILVNMLSMGSMVMVMPLGPDLVVSLSMATEQTGYFSGGATLGAALMGLIASLVRSGQSQARVAGAADLAFSAVDGLRPGTKQPAAAGAVWPGRLQLSWWYP